MNQGLKEAILATYTAYLDAFRASDVSSLDKLIQYPLTYIGNGRTTMVDSYPVQPAELMSAKQWHDTLNLDPEVVFVSTEKAHLVVRQATRVRVDESPIEIVSAFLRSHPDAVGLEMFCALRHHRPSLTPKRGKRLHAEPCRNLETDRSAILR